MSLLLLMGRDGKGADISFNGPMLGIPYSLSRLGFTYTRNSPKTAYQNGLLVTASANQFVTTYDSVTGLHAFEAEPAATNLVTYSNDFSNAIWTKDQATLSTGHTGPDGLTSATKVIPTAVSSTGHRIRASIATNATICSFFVKADGYSWVKIRSFNSYANFNLSTGVAGTTNAASLIKPVGNGWYRCSLISASNPSTHYLYVDTADSAGIDTGAFTGNGTGGVLVFGAMVETGTRPTSYIATAGSTVTRAADVLSCAVANIPGFNSAGYTLSVDWRLDVAGTGTPYLIQLDDGSASNRACLRLSPTVISSLVSSGGASSAAVGEIATGVVRNKSALSCALNSFLRAVNGVAGTADTLGAMPVGLTTLRIGCSESSISQLNGYIFGFKLIPVALNQAQTNGQT